MSFPTSDTFTFQNTITNPGVAFRFIGEDSGTITRTMLEMNPNTGVILYESGVNVANVLPPASGGLEVNNTLAGGGLEPVATMEEFQGTFTPTFTGFSAAPTATVRYRIINRIAYVTIDPIISTGTSNATTFTINNVPAALRPDLAQIAWIPSAINNSVNVGGMTIDLQAASASWLFGFENNNPGGGGWTAAGSKGFATGDGYTFVYNLDAL